MNISYKRKIIITALIIFLLAVAVRSAPVVYKRYSHKLSYYHLVAARNLAESGKFAVESEKNVVLSSHRIGQEGATPKNIAHEYTPVIYGWIFKLFGFGQTYPLYISMALYALGNVLLFFLILKIFNYRAAIIFSIIDILCPIIIVWSNVAGSYDLAMFFFILALFAYFYQEKAKPHLLVISGLLLGVAALCRTPFLFSVIPLASYELIQNRSLRRFFIFTIPFSLVFLGLFGFNFLFSSHSGAPVGAVNFDGHLFRDPYTFHFEKEKYFQQVGASNNADMIGYLRAYGQHLSLKQQLWFRISSARYYLIYTFRLITFGGVVMVFLAGLGFYYLFKIKKNLFWLALIWLISCFGIHILIGTSNHDHFLEVRFPVILLMTGGFLLFFQFIEKQKIPTKTVNILFVLIMTVVVLHLTEANKWSFHEMYSNSESSQLKEVIDILKEHRDEMSDSDVVAVSFSEVAPIIFNYYTNKSFVYFAPETIQELIKQNKLQDGFDYFGVTKIVGYSPAFSDEIMKNARVGNITSYVPEECTLYSTY
ncbi:glycosyltransferase family 39 protein [Patescibacteria group bacterium]|nr:glycosyltransferase family 39 protein [Patescibacteria group bacterium]MBU4511796.1 glycosyltransferase family 39 protein [Patescibacteria group bacterium]